MRTKNAIPTPTIVPFLMVVVEHSAGGGAELSCPISLEKMKNTAPDWGAFMLANESCISFCSNSIGPTRCSDWGYEWFDNDGLAPGEQWRVQLLHGRRIKSSYCS